MLISLQKMADCANLSAGERELQPEDITLVHEVFSLNVDNFIEIVAEAVATTAPPAFTDENSDEKLDEMAHLPRDMDFTWLTVNQRVGLVTKAMKSFITAVESEPTLRVCVARCCVVSRCAVIKMT